MTKMIILKSKILKVSNKMPSIIKMLLSTLKYQSVFYFNMYANIDCSSV